jgi:hypothetical protein
MLWARKGWSSTSEGLWIPFYDVNLQPNVVHKYDCKYTSLCMCTCVCVCMYEYMCICVFVMWVYVFVLVYVFMCVCICVCACVYACMHVCGILRMHAFACITAIKIFLAFSFLGGHLSFDASASFITCHFLSACSPWKAISLGRWMWTELFGERERICLQMPLCWASLADVCALTFECRALLKSGLWSFLGLGTDLVLSLPALESRCLPAKRS